MATALRQAAHKRGVLPLPSFSPTLIIVVLGVLVVFYLIMRLLSDRPDVKGQLDIDVKDFGKISLKTQGTKPELVEIINQLFADADKSRVTLSLLRNHDLYRPDDPSLPAALAKLPPTHEVSQALREFVKTAKGPFGGIEKEVTINVSSEKSITGLIASSCMNSGFQGDSLWFWRENTITTLSVSGAAFPCPPQSDKPFPIVRVSREKYRELFGTVSPREQNITVSIYPFQPIALVPNF